MLVINFDRLRGRIFIFSTVLLTFKMYFIGSVIVKLSSELLFNKSFLAVHSSSFCFPRTPL